MHGILLESGVNNCYWNIKGKCTNKLITGTKEATQYGRDWASSQKCTYTIFGVLLCGEYKQQRG